MPRAVNTSSDGAPPPQYPTNHKAIPHRQQATAGKQSKTHQPPACRPMGQQQRATCAATLMRPHQRPRTSVHAPAPTPQVNIKPDAVLALTHTLVRVDQKPRSSQAHPSSLPTQSRIPTTLAGKSPGQGCQQHTTTRGTVHDATRGCSQQQLCGRDSPHPGDAKHTAQQGTTQNRHQAGQVIQISLGAPQQLAASAPRTSCMPHATAGRCWELLEQ